MHCSSGGSIGGTRGDWGPPYVSTTMRPEGPKKKNFGHHPPPPSPFTAAMADPGEGPGGAATPCFSTKMRPEGPKKKFLESGLPPHLRVW